MASQSEAVAFIRANYQVEELAPNTFKIAFNSGGLRSQNVYVGVTDYELQVTAPFAWQKDISADRALTANSSMFGVVIINGAFALKHNAFLADLDASEIEKAFKILAGYADELEKQLGNSDEF
jgi:hypothetical protein